jgi:hypothetical protein
MADLLYPFVLTTTTDRLIYEIFSGLSDFEGLDEGVEYIGDVIEGLQETNYTASEYGWELVWFKEMKREPRDVVADVAHLVREFDGSRRYAAVAFSRNTNSYYVFLHPSRHIYHLTRSDIVYYYYTRDANYILRVLEEERALLHGNEEGFDTLDDFSFILDLHDDEELAKEVAEDGVAWLDVRMWCITRRPLMNCVYVVAEFREPASGLERKAWRRVELPALCAWDSAEECRSSLAKQFLKP